jgi:hypothetical protein
MQDRIQDKIQEIPLRDIKPLVEIQEYSLYYFSALALLAILFVTGAIYFLVKYVKSKKAFNVRKEHLKLMNAIDFSDAKRDAYDMTLYGATFKNDSPKHLDAYENMLDKLEEYKYKRTVDEVKEEAKLYADLYRGMIDV